MKRLTIAVLGLSLLVPAASFAQDTGGIKSGRKTPAAEEETGKKGAESGKKASRVVGKAHKGGKAQKGHKGGKIEQPNTVTDPKTTSKDPKTTSKDPKTLK